MQHMFPAPLRDQNQIWVILLVEDEYNYLFEIKLC